MVYTTIKGELFDTERDFSSAERHILQKLFLWKDMAASIDEFRRKKQEAFLKGWNNSGPIQESRAMKSIIMDLETRVALRLRSAKKE